MSLDQEQLLDLKQDIDEAKEKKATLQGRKDVLVEQLEKKWNVSTPTKASAKLQEMEQEIETMDEEIKEATEKLEKQLQNENKNNNSRE
ncbi:MAG: hypothetical protein KAS32_03915 [Candidatus Peribacteraceae bacterium]|nr:hypothetical protein [Candidatus Peribacteraceae bacterium]